LSWHTVWLLTQRRLLYFGAWPISCPCVLSGSGLPPSFGWHHGSSLTVDGYLRLARVGVVRRHLADLRGRGILQSLGQRDLLTATRATVAALGRTCNRPVVPIDLPLLSGLSASARSPVAWVRCADSHWGCRVMLLLLCLYLSHLSTSRANPAHILGYHKHGGL